MELLASYLSEEICAMASPDHQQKEKAGDQVMVQKNGVGNHSRKVQIVKEKPAATTGWRYMIKPNRRLIPLKIFILFFYGGVAALYPYLVSQIPRSSFIARVGSCDSPFSFTGDPHEKPRYHSHADRTDVHDISNLCLRWSAAGWSYRSRIISYYAL